MRIKGTVRREIKIHSNPICSELWKTGRISAQVDGCLNPRNVNLFYRRGNARFSLSVCLFHLSSLLPIPFYLFKSENILRRIFASRFMSGIVIPSISCVFIAPILRGSKENCFSIFFFFFSVAVAEHSSVTPPTKLDCACSVPDLIYTPAKIRHSLFLSIILLNKGKFRLHFCFFALEGATLAY